MAWSGSSTIEERKACTDEQGCPLRNVYVFNESPVATDDWGTKRKDDGFGRFSNRIWCGRVQAKNFTEHGVHIWEGVQAIPAPL